MSVKRSSQPIYRKNEVLTNLHQRMKKQNLNGLWVFAVFLVGTISFGYYSSIESSNLNQFKSQLETALHNAEADLEKVFLNDVLLQEIINLYEKDSLQGDDVKPAEIERLAKANYSILIYQEHRLVFWSDNKVSLSLEDLAQIQQKDQSNLINLHNGYYEYYQKKLLGPEGEYLVVGMLPVKKEYEIRSNYLQNQFAHVSIFPRNLELSTIPTSHNVYNKDGSFLFGLQVTGALTSPFQQMIFLVLLAGTVISVLFLINNIGAYFFKRRLVVAGLFFLLVSVGGLKVVSKLYDLEEFFGSIPYLGEIFRIPVFNGSLADLIINSLLVFWLSIFFHHHIHWNVRSVMARWKKWSITLLVQIVILGLLLFIVRVFRALVLETDLILDFDNILYFNFHSILAILSVLLLMVAQFLLTHRLLLMVQDFDLSWGERLAILGMTLMIFSPLVLLVDFQITPALIFLSFTLYLLISYLFLQSELPGLTWSIMWITLFSAFGAALLSQYNTVKEKDRQLTLAQQLAEPRDTISEEKLYQLGLSLLVDDSIEVWLDRDRIDMSLLRTRIDPQFIEDSRLFNRFTYDIMALSKGGRYAPITGQLFREINPYFENNDLYEATDYPNLFSLQTGSNQFSYAIRQSFGAEEGRAPSSEILLIFSPIRRQLSKVYSELLFSEERNDWIYQEYDYQVIRNGDIIDQNGEPNQRLLYLASSLKKGQWQTAVTNDRIDLIYRAANDNLVLVGNQTGGISKAFSLFSYLFIVSVLLLLILNGVNLFLNWLPDTISFAFKRAPSFRNRIQVAVVSLTIGSFVLVGIVTAGFFQRSSLDYHDNRFSRKINTIVSDLEHNINYSHRFGIWNINLKRLAAALSDIHNMDINLFNLDGTLMASSAGYIYDHGVIAPLMSSMAYYELRSGVSNIKRQEEKLGNLSFQSAYIPIKSIDQETLGYLNIPYYSEESDLRNNIYQFIGAMLNVYVFLLIIAGISAIFVARSITKPLEEVGDSLKMVKLGKNNPITWKGKDEIGQLITEYNKMITKLEENTEMLKISEREGAWREMAKQVAHEIKNPLTPMKLSIQYLLHATKTNPNNIEPLLKRVSDTLIEQIDGLSRIASEFSNFAKMPKAQREVFNLNELLHSVYQLFSKSEPPNIRIGLELPDQQFLVNADRGHLMRVFNNLVQNAIQAIPDQHSGEIKIQLIQLDAQHLAVKVMDNGTGISSEIRKKVFFPNFTTKNSGMGLGLAISKNIIDNIDGNIYFQSEEGVGTTFTVELPIHQEKEAAVAL